jgi:hypothetical protein
MKDFLGFHGGTDDEGSSDQRPALSIERESRFESHQTPGNPLATRPDAREAVELARAMDGTHRDRALAVAKIVIDDVGTRGTFILLDGVKPAVLLREPTRLVRLGLGDPRLKQLLWQYGISSQETLGRYVVEALEHRARDQGRTFSVHTFSHYERATGVLYVHDQADAVYRIAPDGSVGTIPNGSEDIFFSAVSGAAPMTPAQPGGSKLDELIFGTVNFKAEDADALGDRRLMLRLWMFAQFFPELLPTKPLLLLVGERGATKTSTIRRLGRALLGPHFEVMPLSGDRRDVETAITNEPLAALDNVDRSPRWLEDLLAVAATGGRIGRRRLNTTNAFETFSMRAFVALTARTPRFTREDVLERLLVLPLDRRVSFVSEAELLAEVDRQRDALLGEIIFRVLPGIVRALHERAYERIETSTRMADFAAFAVKAAGALGSTEEQVRRALERLARDQAALTDAGTDLAGLIGRWLAADATNEGRSVSTRELFAELREIATHAGLSFGCQSTLAFGHAFTRARAGLGSAFEVEDRVGHARARLLSFRRRSGVQMSPEIATDPSGAQGAVEQAPLSGRIAS